MQELPGLVFVLRPEQPGYHGDYLQLPPGQIVRRSALWLHDAILHRAAPLPDWTARTR